MVFFSLYARVISFFFIFLLVLMSYLSVNDMKYTLNNRALIYVQAFL